MSVCLSVHLLTYIHMYYMWCLCCRCANASASAAIYAHTSQFRWSSPWMPCVAVGQLLAALASSIYDFTAFTMRASAIALLTCLAQAFMLSPTAPLLLVWKSTALRCWARRVSFLMCKYVLVVAIFSLSQEIFHILTPCNWVGNAACSLFAIFTRQESHIQLVLALMVVVVDIHYASARGVSLIIC